MSKNTDYEPILEPFAEESVPEEISRNDFFESLWEIHKLLLENNNLQKQHNKHLKSISTAASVIAVIMVISAAISVYYGVSLYQAYERLSMLF